MHEKVIVGVTDAAASRRAVDWAADRAAGRGDGLELLAIVGGDLGEGDVGDHAVETTQGMLDREAERVRALGVPSRHGSAVASRSSGSAKPPAAPCCW